MSCLKKRAIGLTLHQGWFLAEELELLKLTYITQRDELNEAEQASILAAEQWA